MSGSKLDHREVPDRTFVSRIERDGLQAVCPPGVVVLELTLGMAFGIERAGTRRIELDRGVCVGYRFGVTLRVVIGEGTVHEGVGSCRIEFERFGAIRNSLLVAFEGYF